MRNFLPALIAAAEELEERKANNWQNFMDAPGGWERLKVERDDWKAEAERLCEERDRLREELVNLQLMKLVDLADKVDRKAVEENAHPERRIRRMDDRRLNTGELMAMGILNVPPPKTDIPEDAEQVGVDVDEMDDEAMLADLEAGKALYCPEYYGIPHVWKAADDEYRGTLLQYRQVTEDETFTTAGDAVKWFKSRAYACAG